MSLARFKALAPLVAIVMAGAGSVVGQAQPNILVIWGDDVGQSNISAYTMGVMGYRTPNIDRIANEGMIFTDYIRRAELHRRSVIVHHGAERISDWP